MGNAHEPGVRVLALTPVPEEGAGCRFRISQYVPSLSAAGFEVTIAPFFDPAFFRIVYQPGHYAAKVGSFLRQTLDRVRLLVTRGRYDLFFVYREAFPFGPPLVETILSHAGGRPLVYDFDDAIFLSNTSEANRFTAALKCPQKVRAIIDRSDLVIAGNTYLADYARHYNQEVTVIPTCVDTTVFVPRARPGQAGGARVVGWIGTPTTAPYLEAIAAPLRRVAAGRDVVMRVCGAGAPVSFDGVRVAHEAWALAREVELFNTCDVGVYPLPDNDWARGKCGFKAIQFMACGVPVVASPVGVNVEIIQDGVNGFLASTEDEWADKLGRLLDDAALRRRLAEAGRRTIEERYSLRVNAPKMAATLRAVAERPRGGGLA